MATRVVSASIDEGLAEKLDQVAADTNRNKSYFIDQALRENFEELEDYEIALARRGGAATPGYVAIALPTTASSTRSCRANS